VESRRTAKSCLHNAFKVDLWVQFFPQPVHDPTATALPASLVRFDLQEPVALKFSLHVGSGDDYESCSSDDGAVPGNGDSSDDEVLIEPDRRPLVG
jgi:hypothetical protein